MTSNTSSFEGFSIDATNLDRCEGCKISVVSQLDDNKAIMIPFGGRPNQVMHEEDISPESVKRRFIACQGLRGIVLKRCGAG